MAVAANDIDGKSRPRRRRFQFSLRTLLLLTAVLGLFFGWLGKTLRRVQHQRRIVARIGRAGGSVYYDYQLAGEHIDAKAPPGPKLVRMVLGEDVFAHVEAVQFEERDTKDRDLTVLKELPELKDVSVWGPSVTDAGLAHVAAIPKLRGLALTDTRVTADGLRQLSQANELVYLALHGASVTDATLAHLDKLPKLAYLQLIRTSVTDNGLALVGALRHLREVDLYEAPSVSDAGLEKLRDLCDLEALRLLGTSVTDQGLEHVGQLERLRVLHLQGHPITDAGLAELRNLTRLTSLSLNGTAVNDTGLAHLAQFRELEDLDLSHTKASDAGLEHLRDLSKLRILRLHGTAVTDAGLAHLYSLKALQFLELSVGQGVTKGGVEQLKEQLPGCHFTCWRLQPGGGGYLDFEL